MRRNKRHNGGIIIDLTSLLDVIFIILLVVICYASSLNNSISKVIGDEQDEIDYLDNEKKTYSHMNKELENITDTVGIIVIRVPYDNSDFKKRTIHVLENGKEEIQKYDIVGNEKIAEQSELYTYLEEYINEHNNGPVIISLNDNDDDILYRDETEIKEMIANLKEEHSNIYEN